MVATVECSECLVRDFTDGCVLIRGICYGRVSHAVLAWSAGALVTQTALIEWSNESADVRLWHKADIELSLSNVRFWGKADIEISVRDVCF
jgi:hypothetical protein